MNNSRHVLLLLLLSLPRRALLAKDVRATLLMRGAVLTAYERANLMLLFVRATQDASLLGALPNRCEGILLWRGCEQAARRMKRVALVRRGQRAGYRSPLKVWIAECSVIAFEIKRKVS
jgi:hypothetical protein